VTLQELRGSSIPQVCRTEYFLGFVVFTYGSAQSQSITLLLPNAQHRVAAECEDKRTEEGIHLERHILVGLVDQLHAARSLPLDLIFSARHKKEARRKSVQVSMAKLGRSGP
jgi:hypothetical protein